MNLLRACEHCGHHQRVGAQLLCTEPMVRGPHRSVPCEQARGRDGGCGWNAERLLWPAIGCGSPQRTQPAHAA